MEEIICRGLNSDKGIDERHSQVDRVTLKIHFFMDNIVYEDLYQL